MKRPRGDILDKSFYSGKPVYFRGANAAETLWIQQELLKMGFAWDNGSAKMETRRSVQAGFRVEGGRLMMGQSKSPMGSLHQINGTKDFLAAMKARSRRVAAEKEKREAFNQQAKRGMPSGKAVTASARPRITSRITPQ